MATKNNEEELYEYYDENLENQAQAVQDYYNMAREQRYTDLLNQEIEMENSKQNALKYTQNQLANQGFDSQGYGSSVQAGIYNNYANNIAQAQSDYSFDISGKNYEEQQQLNNIRLQDSALRQENQNRQFENILGLVQSSTSKEEMDKYLDTLGYENIMTNKPEEMSDYQWNMMKLAIEEKENLIEEEKEKDTYTANEIPELTYINTRKKEGAAKDRIPSSTLKALENNDFENGAIIKLYATWDKNDLYLIYDNGRFKLSDYETFENAKKQNLKYYDIINGGIYSI